jgi:hypothetical protein
MGKNQDPGSRTNIPDPQHCFKLQENIVVGNKEWTPWRREKEV